MELLEKLNEGEQECFERHYVRCDFDDACDVCYNPTQGSYAVGYDNYNGEVDSYICGTCALLELPKRLKSDKEDWENMEKWIKS